MSGSLESVRWNACVHRLDFSLYSHPKEFWGSGVRTHVNSKGKYPSTGGSEEVQTRDAASRRTASPTHYRLSYSGPLSFLSQRGLSKPHTRRPPRWPSGEGVRLESGRSQVRIPLAPGFFRGRVIPVTSKLALQRRPCQAPGVIGSSLGLAYHVSVYCDWARWKV